MVFEPNFTKVVSSTRKNIGTTQSIIDVKLPTNDNSISKIYSVGAMSTIESNNVKNKEIEFFGVVQFQSIYESEGLKETTYSAEFKDRLMVDKESIGELIITSNVVDIKSEIVSGGIRVVAIVEVVIDEICNKDLKVLTNIEGDNIHLSTNEITYTNYLGKAYEKYEFNEEFQINNVTNILMLTPYICLRSIDTRDNYLVVNGKLNVDICYQSGVEINDLKTHYDEFDFSFEVALDGIRSDDCVQSVLGIMFNEIRVSTTIEDGVANINMFVPITYSGYVFRENKVTVVEDLYLESNYTSITCENFYTVSCNKDICFKDNISGTASILDTAPFIDEVLGVCASNLVLASNKIVEDKLILEGVANTTVMYYTKETNEITSIEVDMPFVVEERVDGEFLWVVNVCLENLHARSKRGKEIEVSAEINVYASTYSVDENCVISDVVLGEEKSQEECSLFVYIVKPNQTIWDVAKENSVSQDLIIEQNPQLELPLKAGDKIVIYKPKIMKF